MPHRPKLSPSAEWNRPYRQQDTCVALASSLAADPPVRYADGRPVGAGYTVPREPQWKEGSTESVDCSDLPGNVRLDLTESLPRDGAAAPELFFHKGGQGYDPGTVPYGHL